MLKLTVQNLADCNVAVAQDQTLLKALEACHIDWMQACGGKGRCTTCRIVVLEGMQHVSSLTAAEEKFRNNGRLKDNERLLCQCTLEGGNVTGVVPDETKLPHLVYND